MNMEVISLQNVKEKRSKAFLKHGIRVEVNGRMGIVTSGNDSLNINVRYESNNFSQNCHPQWETRYFDKDGVVIADYRKESGYEQFDGAKFFK
ncbi:hypothetical protein [Viridibacillus arvi]|uniref:hypothetical protein n=1 Tax=Viridibacillus arvi TaxID=263475 RepID=UPI0036E0A772